MLTNQIEAQGRDAASLQMHQDRLSTPVSLKAPFHSVGNSCGLPISTNLLNTGHQIWIGVWGVAWSQTEIVTSAMWYEGLSSESSLLTGRHRARSCGILGGEEDGEDLQMVSQHTWSHRGGYSILGRVVVMGSWKVHICMKENSTEILIQWKYQWMLWFLKEKTLIFFPVCNGNF